MIKLCVVAFSFFPFARSGLVRHMGRAARAIFYSLGVREEGGGAGESKTKNSEKSIVSATDSSHEERERANVR